MNRRELAVGLAAASAGLALGRAARAAEPIRVLIWDEQQPAQKEAYPNFLGNAIADHLRKQGAAFDVRSARLDDPEQGLSTAAIEATDVLIWWGHQRHGEVKREKALALVERIRAGKLSLLALHSAHWSVPFIEAMNARAVDDALSSLPQAERRKARVTTVPAQMRLYRKDEPVTPSCERKVGVDGQIELVVKLPSCVFTGVRNDGTPSHLRTVLPRHPIAKGVPESFDIPKTEIYDGPFHVPKPDSMIFHERWDGGEQFDSGCLWGLGKGEVFYFRPGHETYPIFLQEIPIRIVENAVRHLGRRAGR